MRWTPWFFYERPMFSSIEYSPASARFPRSWRRFAGNENSLGEKVWIRGIISSHLGVPELNPVYRHHQSHAATAFLTAPRIAPRFLTQMLWGVGNAVSR